MGFSTGGALIIYAAEVRGLHSSTFRLNVNTFCWMR